MGRSHSERFCIAKVASVLAAGLVAAAALGTSSAVAVVANVNTGAETITIGAQPRSTALLSGLQPTAQSFANAEGHPVMHSSATYAIYWDPGYRYHGDWEKLVNTFLQRAGAESGQTDNVFSVNEQYTDATNQRAAYSEAFRGAYHDVTEYPASGCVDPDTVGGYPAASAQLDNVACLTDQQLREQLKTFITANKLPTGMGVSFLLLTPPGVTVCIDNGGTLNSHCSDTLESSNSFCSYHAAISPGDPTQGNSETVLYAAIPWTAGGAGDFHLFDRAQAYQCQDGGNDITEKEVPEKPPHEQEPNQLEPGVRGPDGTFDEGLADLIINQVAVEQQNMSTDPLLNAWHDSLGNEATDECRDNFGLAAGGESEAKEGTEAGTLYNQEVGKGHYYLNDAFSLAALEQAYPGIPCMPDLDLVPQFTAPNPVNAGELVGFDAEESDLTLDAGVAYTAGVPHRTYPTYEWSFGDGIKTTPTGPPGESPVDQPSVFHAYQYGGTYVVTLTITDTGGNVLTTSNEITVDGPPPPSQVTGQSGVAPQSAPTNSGGRAVSATGTPTFTESVVSGSLSKVVRLGLPIKYKVNEQVAGRIEALLEKTTAARLGIKGPLAVGLPKGYPRETIVGTAVLVTTRAGQGTVRIKFSKTVAKHLAKASRVKLTLRFVLHNASSGSVRTTTALSTVVLSH